VRHIALLEETQDVGDGIDLTDRPQKLVPQPFAPARPLHQTGDIDELDGARGALLGIEELLELEQPGIGHRHHTQVAVDGGKRIVGDVGVPGRQGIEEGRFAHIRQPDDPYREHHPDSTQAGSSWRPKKNPTSLSEMDALRKLYLWRATASLIFRPTQKIPSGGEIEVLVLSTQT
jgi:hypothetical protein